MKRGGFTGGGVTSLKQRKQQQHQQLFAQARAKIRAREELEQHSQAFRDESRSSYSAVSSSSPLRTPTFRPPAFLTGGSRKRQPDGGCRAGAVVIEDEAESSDCVVPSSSPQFATPRQSEVTFTASGPSLPHPQALS